MSEADKMAKRLRKEGWTVERQIRSAGPFWVARHPKAKKIITFKKALNPQRVLDEAADALKQLPRTTSGLNRKQKAARQREHEQGREAAHRKALDAVLASQQQDAAPDEMIVSATPDELAITPTSATKHALIRAKQRGIRSDMVYDTLRCPKEVRPGESVDTVLYIGHECSVVIGLSGAIVSVWR